MARIDEGARPAFEPSRPSSPGGSFVFGLALILGVIMGIVVAFVLDYFDTRIYSPEQVRQAASAPVLGSISKVQDRQRVDGLLTIDPTTQRDYWILRAQLQPMIQEGSVKTILVTSPGGAEGKSTVIYRLATVMAQNNLKVLVIDADLRPPAQIRLFDVSAEHGLYEFLMGEQADLQQLILKDVKPGIDLLPSLTECENPLALLESPNLKVLFQSIEDYDVVLIDSTALLDFPDALALADHVHSVIPVVRWGHTTSESIQVACTQLESIGAKNLGIVINRAQVRKNSESLASDVKRARLTLGLLSPTVPGPLRGRAGPRADADPARRVGGTPALPLASQLEFLGLRTAIRTHPELNPSEWVEPNR